MNAYLNKMSRFTPQSNKMTDEQYSRIEKVAPWMIQAHRAMSATPLDGHNLSLLGQVYSELTGRNFNPRCGSCMKDMYQRLGAKLLEYVENRKKLDPTWQAPT